MADRLAGVRLIDTSEKYYIICGEEFGLENVGKRALIVCALYGGKAAGRNFGIICEAVRSL